MFSWAAFGHKQPFSYTLVQARTKNRSMTDQFRLQVVIFLNVRYGLRFQRVDATPIL
jgi:hypothetical protein